MELMDAQFIRLVKEKLKLLRNDSKMKENSLRNICLKRVIQLALTNKNSSVAHGIENLPEVLLTDLEVLMTDYAARASIIPSTAMKKSMCHFLAHLLHPSLTKLRVPGPSYWTEDMYVEVVSLLDKVGAKCPALTLIESKKVDVGQKLEEHSQIKAAFFRALPKLLNLQVVRIHFFVCDNWALQQFGMHGENIVTLQVALAEEVSDIGIKALAKLTHLKEFLFETRGKWFKAIAKWLLMCGRHLPKLKIVGSDFVDFNLDSYSTVVNDGKFYHSRVMKLPLQLGLEQVLLSGDVVTNPCCLLPHLRSLLLYCPSGDVSGLCSRYSRILELGLYGAECDVILEAVQVVGHRLEKLIICEIGEDFTELPLNLILKRCPNLKHLKVERCTLGGLDYTKDDVRCMETVEISEIDEPLPLGFIVMLLGAPLLKKVDFYETYLTKVEVDALLASVWQGSLLTNIESFRWVNHYEEDEMRSWMASQKHFKLLLATIQVSVQN